MFLKRDAMKATEKRNLVLTLLLMAALAPAQAAAQKERPFEPTWESLKQYRVPAWFEDAKFGIFIHWGPYAAPAFGSEWYPRRMYQKYRTNSEGKVTGGEEPVFQHHLERWGPQSKFGYKDFIPMFQAERWDPEQWADLFHQAGARYVVPVAEHHDGFAMYASSLTKWNAAQMGPRRDALGELAKAVRKRGMKLGASSHYAFNWRYYTFGEDYDTNDPNNSGLYGKPHPVGEPASKEFLDLWFGRTVEIIDKYQPDVMWFDFCMNFPEFEPYRRKVGAHYYNQARAWGREVALNYKNVRDGRFPEGTAVLDIERGKLDKIRDMVWQTDTSVSKKSWGYIENDEFKTTDSLVDDLVDIVSKNGVLLLNVGPKADGTIPDQAQKILLEIGRWLKVNGEAIYGTRPWKVFGEGPTQVAQGHMSEARNQPFTFRDIRFTTKGQTLYAIALDWPGEKLTIQSLASSSKLESRNISSVHLLGVSQPLPWKRGVDGLIIELPKTRPCDYACVFKIAFH